MQGHEFIFHSLAAEDSIVDTTIKKIKEVSAKDISQSFTYIDVGCFHPIIRNNTYFLYKKGHRGTVVEPNPHLTQEIMHHRPEDVMVQCAVAAQSGTVDFYLMEQDWASSACVPYADSFGEKYGIFGKETIKVPTATLDAVVGRHVKSFGSSPTLIDLDTAGFNFDVIKTYSFTHRPLLFLVKDTYVSSFDASSRLRKLMKSKSYFPVGGSYASTLYVDGEAAAFDAILQASPEMNR